MVTSSHLITRSRYRGEEVLRNLKGGGIQYFQAHFLD